ncbi:MAG: hypothetical protein H7Y17_10085, partial [Chlorobia bacterium]|nr:hypothetical protein [Fimbriimonadaceae bacterium]
MLRRSAGLAVLSLCAALAGAQPQTYAQRGTQIRAGIALLDSAQTAGVPSNPTPFVWYNLDSNREVKPAGWNIYNPNAPGQATPAIVTRWTLLAGAVGGGVPADLERINKRHAAYWEVRISQATEVQMAQYDVLFINAAGNVSLNTIERERLRQFVDRGGVLWVEVANIGGNFNTDNTINNFPLPFGLGGAGAGFGRLDVFHPVLSYPYAFNASNLDYLNNGGVGLTLNQATPPGSAGALNPALFGDWFKLKPVVLQGGAATMMVGRIGDGFTVISTRNAGNFLNRIRTGAGYLPNNQYYAQKPEGGLDKGSDVLGKLAINVISLGSSSEQPGNGTRKSGSSPIDIGAPLLTRFNEPVPGLDHGLKNQFPAAAYKGLAVVSTTTGIRVYDANPKSDLDGDGNPDDGVQDLSLGADLDLVWTSNGLAGPISAPTCIEVAQPGGGIPVDQILVTQADGSVAAFNAFPTTPGGQILPGPHAPVYTVAAPANVVSVDTSQINHGPYAPTYHEGLAYVASNPGAPTPTGQVWMFNPATGLGLDTAGQRWLVGDPFGPAIQQISGPPTVGYIPIADNSSGLDKVVYVPSRPGSTLAGPNAGIYSLWAGARGESPIAATVVGPTLTVTTRASQRGLWVVTGGLPSLGVKLTVLRANGDPLTIPEMNLLFGGGTLQSSPGVLDFVLTGAWDPTYTVRVDYTIDWGRGPGASQSIVRGNIFLPDDINNRRTILGSIAMSNQGTIYVVHSTTNEGAPLGGGPSEGGAFYAFRERGQGAFRCVARYDAFRRHTINLNQAASIQVPATFADNDPLIALVGILGGTADRMTFMTGPAVRGDYVYAGAILRKTGGFITQFIPFTVLMAFKAEPETAEIQIGDLSDGFTLVQPDTIRSANKSVPTQFNVAGQGQYQYVRESGKIRFDSLMTPNRGQISSCFSLSQPVILRSGGRPDRLVYPDANAGSKWSPLAWYTVLHGFDSPTTPVVTGGTLFMGGSSSLPELILSGNPLNPTGVLFGINADIGERDSFNFPDPGRPWNRQAVVLKDNGGGSIDSNPNIRWPQNQGITSFQVWATRVLQASMPGTDRTMSIAAGEGALFATGGPTAGGYGGPGSIYGFSRADFVVCDEGRLGRYDPAGNPIFATDVSNNSGIDVNVGGASSVRAVQRPIRAYPVGASDLAVVDPATNRIVRLDGAGRELRSIEAFRLDSASNVTLEANEPYTLNNPRDVAVYTEYVANPTNVSNPQPLEYWVHYVIADAGNRRVIDLIDRYEADATTRVVGDAVLVGTQRQLGMLRWHSPAEYSGKRFEYNAIARAYDAGTNTYYYVAGIGSATPTKVDTGLDSPAGALPREAKDGNGGIVIFSPVNPTANTIINEIAIPFIPAGSYIDPVTETYATVATPAKEKKLSNLTSVTVRNIRNGAGTLWAIMFTDATGVYEITQPVLNGPWVVRWMMPKEVYRYLRNAPAVAPFPNIFGTNPESLRANYARRLDSGEVLIVNGYVGKLRGGADF